MEFLAKIAVIPHAEQRYPTTGDWRYDKDGVLHVSVSDMGNRDYETLIGLHEEMEARFCKKAGIEEADVTLYDELYETKRDANDLDTRAAAAEQLRKRFSCNCEPTAISEPGDDIHAPYYQQHQLATSVERMAAVMLGVSWNDYEAANLKLYEEKP